MARPCLYSQSDVQVRINNPGNINSLYNRHLGQLALAVEIIRNRAYFPNIYRAFTLLVLLKLAASGFHAASCSRPEN